MKCPEGQSTETEGRSVAPRGWGRGGGEVTAHGDGISFWGDGNVLELQRGDGCTTL